MDKPVDEVISVDLQSVVNSHERPFVVIDKNYRILAVNKAYEELHGAESSAAIGRNCYEVSHGKDHPCSVEGEECPHEHVFSKGEPKVCAHVHCDMNHHMHQVRVSAVPLKGPGNEIYLGECIEEINASDNCITTRGRMVGESTEFLACVEQLNIAASSDAPVLLQGETGTGKELAAEFIHSNSSRKLKPFQIVDSTVLTETLFESEMFGHVSGAYTGSVGSKQGLFELAEGGTLFLDEIGDMPLSQQAKLLRVLESGQYRPVGGKTIRRANVRIVCATNRHLWESVLAGTFREDLYYRIACLNIRLPGLRDRTSDIPLLAQNLLEGINRSMRCSYHLVPDALDRLKKHNYPGNVRELRNILFIAATHSINREIDAVLIDKVMKNLPQCASESDTAESEPARSSIASADAHEAEVGATPASVQPAEQPVSLKGIEEQHIRNLLEQFEGNRKLVAEALGISERTIYRKLKALGIN